MSNTHIKNTIVSLFRQNAIMKDITEDQDFYDLGVSSLTIVELQIVVEKELKLEVEASVLMAAPTLAEWIQIYTNAAQAKGESQADVADS